LLSHLYVARHISPPTLGVTPIPYERESAVRVWLSHATVVSGAHARQSWSCEHMAGFQLCVVDVRLGFTNEPNAACLASRVANLSILYFKGLMAPAVHDSDSNDSNAEASPRPSKSHGGSPEQPGQSDQGGPEDSGEEGGEVYEIEAILDAKRGATGSVRFLGRSL
jgi:hypothetical protein